MNSLENKTGKGGLSGNIANERIIKYVSPIPLLNPEKTVNKIAGITKASGW